MRHLWRHLCGWNMRRLGWMPRWEDDRTAKMLGIAQYGCPVCGFGAIAERDRIARDAS